MDIERGNFLKVSADGRILRASHGTQFMSDADVTGAYGPQHSSDSLRQFCRGVADSESPSSPLRTKYRLFKDFFDLPAMLACANIVDLIDQRNDNKPLDKYSFWKHVLCGLVEMFKR